MKSDLVKFLHAESFSLVISMLIQAVQMDICKLVRIICGTNPEISPKVDGNHLWAFESNSEKYTIY